MSRLLAGQRHSLRLVVLNACEGAKGGREDILSSTAATLVQSGLPAVLAMQYDITDGAAVELAESFYDALAAGVPVDTAVTEARNAVSLANEHSLEWGTPVLYLRSADGNLFILPPSPAESTGTAKWTKILIRQNRTTADSDTIPTVNRSGAECKCTAVALLELRR